ncbi:MAG: hypothetical protein A2V67_01640 [Deltaproteobacteria bacterium RBG_13_61_14]|nr:MAG: hypothetical protein A2V67_01640 [Deltaproteobacteria bacterium RBG_13_61_14]
MKLFEPLSLRPVYAGFSGLLANGLNPSKVEELLGADPFVRLRAGAPFALVARTYDKGSWVYRFQADLGEGEQLYYVKVVREKEVWQVMLGRMFSSQGLKRPFHYPKKFIRMLFAPSEAAISWQVAQFLYQHDIATPEFVALLIRRRKGLREEYLISRAVPRLLQANLKEYLVRQFGPGADHYDLQAKRRLLAELAHFLRRLLELPIHFPDLKLHNLLLQEPKPGKFRFLIMDLNEVSEKKPKQEEVIILDRFNRSIPFTDVITQTDRLRFLKAYLAAGKDSRDGRSLSQTIAARSRIHQKPHKPFGPLKK